MPRMVDHNKRRQEAVTGLFAVIAEHGRGAVDVRSVIRLRQKFVGRPLLPFVAAVSVMVIGLLLAGCGSAGQQKDGAAGASAEAAGVSPAASTSVHGGAADEIGAAVSALYEEAMIEVTGLMDLRGSADNLRPKVEELVDTYAERFVALGQQREALDAAGKATVDAAITAGLGALSPELYAAFQKGQAYYQAQDLELGNLIADINVITQYANFDLLRSQEPEEAARLGL